MSMWGSMYARGDGDTVRKEDNNWDGLSFEVEDLVDLPGPEKVSIKDAAWASFNFGGFSSLDKMLSKLEVKLLISPDTPKRIVPSGISEWVLYWKNELQRLEKVLGPDYKNKQFYKDALKELEKAEKERNAWVAMALLGRYDRFSKEIWLFPNNILEEDRPDQRKEYLVTTFVHEAMHAYFDRHPRELFPYVATVEEPLAEFGMLLFLKETNNNYYQWVYDNVVSKETCYRYGAALMDRHLLERTDTNNDTPTRNHLVSAKMGCF